jgi:hypothetical protein
MQTYSLVPSRNLIMAEREMLKHAMPIKVLSTFGSQKQIPQNKTDTVVFRRALPLDAGSNGAPSITASNYLLQEGVTPGARTIAYQDVQVTVQQYGVLMKLSSKAESMYEDDIPGDMVKLVDLLRCGPRWHERRVRQRLGPHVGEHRHHAEQAASGCPSARGCARSARDREAGLFGQLRHDRRRAWLPGVHPH